MSPPTKLRRISPTQCNDKDSGESTVPLLPDDVLLMVFDELAMEERAVLGTTCKRFRELDFKLGKKTFDSIEIGWSYNTISIHAKSPTTEYYLLDRPYSAILQGYHNLSLFRKAQTASLRIKHNGPEGCKSEKLYLISAFIKNVSFKILNVDINCNKDCTDTYIRSLMKNCNFDKIFNFYLKFDGLTSVPRTRELLTQEFPRLDNFYFWCKTAYTCEPVIDDSTLIKIISNINHADLGISQCTGQGILAAFEMFRKSVDYKFVSIEVQQSSADMFFITPHHNFKIGSQTETLRYARDRKTRTILWAKTLEGNLSRIFIGKTCKSKTIIKNPKWV